MCRASSAPCKIICESDVIESAWVYSTLQQVPRMAYVAPANAAGQAGFAGSCPQFPTKTGRPASIMTSDAISPAKSELT